MAEDQNLRERNNEMVKLVQHWKMTAAQKETEKLELKKEVNDLRFKLSRLRNAESDRARKLNKELQSASEEVLSQLVQASSTVARMLDLVKSYMQDRQEIVSTLPRWSSLSKSPASEKVNRVRPLIGGRHIQPVVALNRNEHMMSNQPNMSIPVRAVPLHMLQVYVPLTRIDARRPRNAERPARNGEHPNENVEVNGEENVANNNMEDLASDDGSEEMEALSDQEDFEEEEEPQRLEVVAEEMEMENETPQSSRTDDPMEGPSWLLDVSTDNTQTDTRVKLEPDSTTGSHNNEPIPGPSRHNLQVEIPPPVPAACEFTPTVRRRRRPSPPPPTSPRSPLISLKPVRRNSKDGRILKVLVAKLRLDDDMGGSGDATPPKKPNLSEVQPKRSNTTEVLPKRPNPTEVLPRRLNSSELLPKRSAEMQQNAQSIFPASSPTRCASSPMKRLSVDGSPVSLAWDLTPTQRLMRFDAPSPNGSTDSRVIVFETGNGQPEPCCSGVPRSRTVSRTNSRENHPNHISNHGNHAIVNHGNHSNINHGNHSNINHGNHSNINHDTHPAIPAAQLNHINQDNHRPAATKPRNRSNDNHTPSTSNINNDNFSYVNDIRHSRANRSRLTSHNDNRSSRNDNYISSNDNGADSDSSSSDAISENRTRRARKTVVYKEKPLNRKMRR